MVRQPSRSRPKVSRNSVRDGYFVVAAALLLVFVVAASFSDHRLFPNFQRQVKTVDVQTDSADDDLKTGSIIFVPRNGNICQQKLIDNATWRIRDNGNVICDNAVASNSAQNMRQSRLYRMDAIRDSFAGKK